jgi:tetratricopeptide (TPR) repeat protein
VTEVQAPTVKPTEISDAHGRAEQHDKLEVVRTDVKFDDNPQDVEEPARPDGVAPAVTTGIASASAQASPAPGFGTKDAQYYRERGIRAYRIGDLYIALVNFDLAIHLDPDLPDSYIDRGIVFHRLGDLKRAFADVADAKRIEALNRNTTPSVGSASSR